MKISNTNSWTSRLVGRVAVMVRLLILSAQVQAERKQLRALDGDRLRDIGVSREDAMVEGTRLIGDLPQQRVNEAIWQQNSGQHRYVCGMCGRRFMSQDEPSLLT